MIKLIERIACTESDLETFNKFFSVGEDVREIQNGDLTNPLSIKIHHYFEYRDYEKFKELSKRIWRVTSNYNTYELDVHGNKRNIIMGSFSSNKLSCHDSSYDSVWVLKVDWRYSKRKINNDNKEIKELRNLIQEFNLNYTSTSKADVYVLRDKIKGE